MSLEQALLLPDGAAVADLATFLGRARRVDPDGAARLVGHGDVVAVYVSPVHGGGGPTVLCLRTVTLAAPSRLDVTVPLASLTDRLARNGSARPDGSARPAGGEPVALALPAAPAAGVSWAGVSPPRGGWDAVGLVEPAALHSVAVAGIAEVALGSGNGAGALAVARLRGEVWGRSMPTVDGLPAGVAYAAEALGFVGRDPDDPAALYRSGPWVRLTTSRGHVLARRALLGGGLRD